MRTVHIFIPDISPNSLSLFFLYLHLHPEVPIMSSKLLKAEALGTKNGILSLVCLEHELNDSSIRAIPMLFRSHEPEGDGPDKNCTEHRP